MTKPCPCGIATSYAECCEPYHQTIRSPATAEALMRSRYSAYVLSKESYLLASWHQSTRPSVLDLATEPRTQWLGLKIVNTHNGREMDVDGSVEFVARYKINGKAYRLHEISQFVKEADVWYYLSGKHPA